MAKMQIKVSVLRLSALLNLAYRYTDLGEVETGSDTATIIRSSGTRFLDIGATRAAVRSNAVVLSLRYQCR